MNWAMPSAIGAPVAGSFDWAEGLRLLSEYSCAAMSEGVTSSHPYVPMLSRIRFLISSEIGASSEMAPPKPTFDRPPSVLELPRAIVTATTVVMTRVSTRDPKQPSPARTLFTAPPQTYGSAVTSQDPAVLRWSLRTTASSVALALPVAGVTVSR